MDDVSWFWIALMSTAPFLGGALVAYPLWRLRQTILGSIAGTIVVFGSAIGLMLREYTDVERVTKACLDAGTQCVPVSGAFMRYAVYACIGLVEVFVLFMWSLRVEKQVRNQGYAPEWR